ncbi:MAG: TRAP transporter large permease subunit, partial [Betaproteobacteria bacterium]|nr:TRAP transporter large permease subunit [Betaproteobacteria bacterium]
SVGALFLAGILPGIIMALLMMFTVAFFAHRHGLSMFSFWELCRACTICSIEDSESRFWPPTRQSAKSLWPTTSIVCWQVLKKYIGCDFWATSPKQQFLIFIAIRRKALPIRILIRI